MVFNFDLGYLEVEKDRLVIEVQYAAERARNQVLNTEFEKRKLLEDQIAILNKQLLSSQATHGQISSIRQNLEREKELDILTIKKELMAQKERQLFELRTELSDQKEQLKRVFRAEIDSESAEFQLERKKLDDKVADLQKRLCEELSKNEELAKRPLMLDFAAQVGIQNTEDVKFHSLQKEFQYFKEQISCLFGDNSKLADQADSSDIVHECRAFAQLMSDRTNEMKAEIQSLEEKILIQKDELLSAFQIETNNLEIQHQGALSQLKQTHKTEMSKQAALFDSRISQVQNSHTRIEQEMVRPPVQIPSSPNVNTLQDLLSNYPVLMASYRSQLENVLTSKRWDTRPPDVDKSQQTAERELEDKRLEIQKLESKILNQEDAIKKLEGEMERKLARYAENLDAVKAEALQSNQSEITKKIKAQCSTAYDGALAKLHAEYKKSGAALKAKLEREAALKMESFEIQRRHENSKGLKLRTEAYEEQIRRLQVTKE